MWLAILSDQLSIVAMVGRYPAIKLIKRGPILQQPKPFPTRHHPMGVSGISSSFPELFRTEGHVPTRYSPVCHSHPKMSVRLACVKPAASVRSEPGSNSQVVAQDFAIPTSHYQNSSALRPNPTSPKTHHAPARKDPKAPTNQNRMNSENVTVSANARAAPKRQTQLQTRPQKQPPPTFLLLPM